MKLAQFSSKYRSTLIAEAYTDWVKKGKKALDVGCGTGIVGKELSERLDIKVTGCDIDQYLLVDIPFKKMKSINKLPFTPNSFDYVFFNDVLHHTTYENQKVLIKDALRVGKSVLLFELRPTFISKYGDYILNKIHHPQMEIPYTYHTEIEWEELLQTLSVKVDKIIVRRPLFYPFSHVAYKLS